MRKIFPGNYQVTPYRPWTAERKAAARKLAASERDQKDMSPDEKIDWLLGLVQEEVERTGLEDVEIIRRLGERHRALNMKREADRILNELDKLPTQAS